MEKRVLNNEYTYVRALYNIRITIFSVGYSSLVDVFFFLLSFIDIKEETTPRNPHQCGGKKRKPQIERMNEKKTIKN